MKYYINYLKGRYYVIAVFKVCELDGKVSFLRQAFDKYGDKIMQVKDTYTVNGVDRVNNNLNYSISKNNEILSISRFINFNDIKLNDKKIEYHIPNQSFGNLCIKWW